MSTNDNAPRAAAVTAPMPDPHGHAALLLVESLMHGLLARSIISIGDAIEIVETAESVQVDVADAADGASAAMWQSHTLLTAISESLKRDADSKPRLRPVF